MSAKISLEELLEAGCHFGHQKSRWNPKMAPYIYGQKDGVHVLDLAKTKEKLEEAISFVKSVIANGGNIVFVGTKRQAQAVIQEEAKRVGMPYVAKRWLGGLFTNWEETYKRIKKLLEMRDKKEKGEFQKYTKHEQLLIDREIAKLDSVLGGLVALDDIPSALYIVDIKKEATAIREAVQREIPTVAIVDSNCDPTPVDYMIPANDDAVGSIKLITHLIADAIEEASNKKPVVKTTPKAS